MKRVTESHRTERSGVLAVARIVNDELGWVFRKQDEDYGIDAQIEVITDCMATGKIIAVQIKSGPSYFTHEDTAGIVFRGTLEHLDYWLNHDLPVIVILYEPETETAYWQHVTTAHVTRTPDGWKMSIPRQQKLEAAQANRLDEIASTLQHLKDKIREYQCPHCGAPLAERGGGGDHSYEAFYCGYQNVDGMPKPPCPWDPKFPRFEDYDLQFHQYPSAPEREWFCIANPKTAMARSLSLNGHGHTKEEAALKVRAKYDQYAKKEKLYFRLGLWPK